MQVYHLLYHQLYVHWYNNVKSTNQNLYYVSNYWYFVLSRILQVLCKDMRLGEQFEFKDLASLTPGFVGADLMALTREAAITAVNRLVAVLGQVHTSVSGSVLMYSGLRKSYKHIHSYMYITYNTHTHMIFHSTNVLGKKCWYLIIIMGVNRIYLQNTIFISKVQLFIWWSITLMQPLLEPSGLRKIC